jgi:tripartite-type tricarboxylate transporter receptor subunit TctC
MYVRGIAHLLAVATLAAVALGSSDAETQQARGYPSRPIHIIVPSAPGGAGDMLAREFGDRSPGPCTSRS